MHSEDFFVGKNKVKIYYQKWIPDTDKPKAIVQIIHGFGEHSGRYKNVVEALLKNNIAVYANDHQGHGKSEGRRNYIPQMEDYAEDCHTLTKIIKTDFPDLPIFILGHSMGSMIAQCYATKYEEEIKGVILSGTGITVGNANPVTVFIGRLLAKIFPKMYIPSGLDPNTLSNDPEVVKEYINDPYVCYKKISVRLGLEMLDYYTRIKTKMSKLNVPFLIQRGELDNALAGYEELYEDIGSKDKTLIIYKDGKHEVYNEVETIREKALEDLVEWIKRHLEH